MGETAGCTGDTSVKKKKEVQRESVKQACTTPLNSIYQRRAMINFVVRPQEPLPATVERRKLWACHALRRQPLQNHLRQGTLEGGRRLGRQRKLLDEQRQRVDIPDHCRNCPLYGQPVEKTVRGSLVNYVRPLDDPIGGRTE